jgi:hypothetical protein
MMRLGSTPVSGLVQVFGKHPEKKPSRRAKAPSINQLL